MIEASQATIRLPYPHQGQQFVRQQSKRFNALCAGRRWRKSTLGVTIAVEEAVNGGKVIWGAPTYDQSRVAFQETSKACLNFAKPNITFMEVPFPSGGSILFRSLDDPNNIRGHTADGVIIDEAASVNPMAWYEALRYMLIDTNGWAWLLGSPKGANNWFKTEWDRFKTMPNGAAWQVPTVGCEVHNGILYRKAHPFENPFIPYEEIEQTFKSVPINQFREEILAEFLEHEGVVFKNVTNCLLNEDKGNPLLHTNHSIVMGVDWGQIKDFTVVSVICETCRIEVEIERYNQVEWHYLLARVRSAMKRWHVHSAVVEYNSIGGPNFEALQEAGLPVRPFITTNKSKATVIQSLVLALERQDFLWLNVPWATSELMAYESKMTAFKNVVYGAPPGQHDDSVIARALALHASQTPGEIEFT